MDHVGLCVPETGSSKKQEIDTISICGYLENVVKFPFFMLQQENRNSSNMDRRKMDMTECSSEGSQGYGNTYNDCEICIGVYHPLKHKLKTHRGIQLYVIVLRF